MLAGQHPFQGCDYNIIQIAIANGYGPARPHWPSIPDPIWDITELCWRHEPMDRPQLDEIFHTLTSGSMSSLAEWPSPPVIASTLSLGNTLTPLITPAVLPDHPTLPTPKISVTELPPCPRHLPPRVPLSELPPLPHLFHGSPEYCLRTTTPAVISHRRVSANSGGVVGGGITKQQPEGANRMSL